MDQNEPDNGPVGGEELTRRSDGSVENAISEDHRSASTMAHGPEGEETAPRSNNNAQDANSGHRPPNTSTRTPSALRSRLLNQQRSNILLQVLFHHMLNNRRRREEEEALAVDPPPLPDREMPILDHEEALEINAMCRFCFEGSIEEGSANTLVAPCNCSGGSRWVHLECLRQWQRLQARILSNPELERGTTTYTTAGYICNVCNSPYLSRPPAIRSLRRNILKRGTLLVAKPGVGRTFQQAVVLLLNDVCGNPHGTFGLIVNSPLQEGLEPINLLQTNSGNSDENVDQATTGANDPVIEWRRGGPVCGGRLGVVQFCVLHTYPPSVSGSLDEYDVDIDEEYFEENENELEDGRGELGDTNLEVPLSDNEDEEGGSESEPHDDDEIGDDGTELLDNSCSPLSLPVFDVDRNTPPLQFVASPHSSTPSTFSEDALSTTVQRLVRDSESNSEIVQLEDSGEERNNDMEPSRVVVFSGYCKWRSGQLEREIQREVWDVCIDATPEDILRHHGSGFWEEMRESDRLLSWNGLIEEDEG